MSESHLGADPDDPACMDGASHHAGGAVGRAHGVVHAVRVSGSLDKWRLGGRVVKSLGQWRGEDGVAAERLQLVLSRRHPVEAGAPRRLHLLLVPVRAGRLPVEWVPAWRNNLN